MSSTVPNPTLICCFALTGKVVSEIKSSYNAELCTQAWCKFHEILASYDVVLPSVLSQPEARLNSIHLCEAPGAFITSLNHFLVSRGEHCLLSPYVHMYTCVNGSVLLSEFYICAGILCVCVWT